MSVLIKGMKMPKTCWECAAENRLNVYVIVFGGHCPFRERIVPIEEFDAKTGRHPSCPLIEVPTPHGRLIDASDLNFSMTDSIDQGIAEEVVADAPTIIEAEEVEA